MKQQWMIKVEERAREAAFIRKNAKEALEHLHLVTMRRLMNKEAPGSGFIGAGGNVGYGAGGFDGAKLKRENNISGSSNRDGVGASTFVEEKINRTGNVNRINNPNPKLGATDAVKLRENEKMDGITSHGMTLNDDQKLMDVDEKAE